MTIKQGDKIKVEYEGKLDDGTVFDSSKGKDPLSFEVGGKQVIKGFDEAVVGMKLNDEKKVELKPSEAYGDKNPKLVRKVPRNVLPKEQEPKKGMMLTLQAPDGKRFPVTITEVDKEEVTIDMNHPLAGKTLHFTIKVVGIND